MNIPDYIKEKASDKAFATISALNNEEDAFQREVKTGVTGGITLEQLLGVVDHIQVQKLIWIYIASLIEKDNLL